MNYIKISSVTNRPCRYKLVTYYNEFDSKVLERNCRIIDYADRLENKPKKAIEYLLRRLHNIATGRKPIKIKSYAHDGLRTKGFNTFKKGIIYDTYEDKPIVELDQYMIEVMQEVLYKSIPFSPPYNLYKGLDSEQKNTFRLFYSNFGWYIQRVNNSEFQWYNNFLK